MWGVYWTCWCILFSQKSIERSGAALLSHVRSACLLFFIFLLGANPKLHGQHSPNSNPYYQQLRNIVPGNEVIAVSNLELHRDAATLTFRHGSFAFFTEVNGKVSGATFKGDGHFHLVPPSVEERHNLSILNHSESFDDDFDEVVLHFSDGTMAELRKAATGKEVA